MRKATLLMSAATIVAIANFSGAEQRAGAESVTMSSPSANPLTHLPGMNASGQIGASVGGTAQVAALPLPQVSDFTNVPNPFDSRKESTMIGYTLAQDSKSTLTIYDLMGMKVIAWGFSAGENGGKTGTNQVSWNGTNETGRKVSKGGYIAELEVETPQGTTTAIRKIGVIH